MEQMEGGQLRRMPPLDLKEELRNYRSVTQWLSIAQKFQFEYVCVL